jgi:glycosyltransferase involved in cell wall biosynthesis
MLKVSIIIPTFNHAKYVLEAIESVAGNTYRNKEIIVIDDGSTDNTQNLLKNLPGITYIVQKNEGAHSALNHGLKVASGDVISILNDDDLFLPDHIALGVSNLVKTGNNLYIGSADAFGQGPKLKVMKNHLEHSRNQIDKFGLKRALFKTNWSTSTSSFIFRKEIANIVGGFSPLRMCHDLDFLLRVLILARSSIGVSLEPSWLYRCHENNSGSHISILRQNAEILYAIGGALFVLSPSLSFARLINIIDYGIPKHHVSYALNVQPWKSEEMYTKQTSIEKWVLQFIDYVEKT